MKQVIIKHASTLYYRNLIYRIQNNVVSVCKSRKHHTPFFIFEVPPILKKESEIVSYLKSTVVQNYLDELLFSSNLQDSITCIVMADGRMRFILKDRGEKHKLNIKLPFYSLENLYYTFLLETRCREWMLKVEDALFFKQKRQEAKEAKEVLKIIDIFKELNTPTIKSIPDLIETEEEVLYFMDFIPLSNISKKIA